MRLKTTALLGVLTAAGILFGNSSATVVNPVIDWTGPESQAYEPGFIPPYTSVAGNQLTIVGVITIPFNSPLSSRHTIPDPTQEYTFVLDQLVSLGSTSNPLTVNTSYTGGRFRVFDDPSLDAVFTANPPNVNVPSTFADGTLILQGTISNFATVSNRSNPGGNYSGDLLVTGGTDFDLMSCRGQGFTGFLLGVWNQLGALQGYIRSCDGKMDFTECPVPVENSTWSRIKILYRD